MGQTATIQWKAKPLTRREIRASIRIVVDAFSRPRARRRLDEAHSAAASRILTPLASTLPASPIRLFRLREFGFELIRLNVHAIRDFGFDL
jgi:hypothetical protein